MIDLLPCPFCGEKPTPHYYGGATLIECESAGCEVLCHVINADRDEAIDAWNRRNDDHD